MGMDELIENASEPDEADEQQEDETEIRDPGDLVKSRVNSGTDDDSGVDNGADRTMDEGDEDLDEAARESTQRPEPEQGDAAEASAEDGLERSEADAEPSSPEPSCSKNTPSQDDSATGRNTRSKRDTPSVARPGDTDDASRERFEEVKQQMKQEFLEDDDGTDEPAADVEDDDDDYEPGDGVIVH